jgi:hypothetical protein
MTATFSMAPSVPWTLKVVETTNSNNLDLKIEDTESLLVSSGRDRLILAFGVVVPTSLSRIV